MSSAKSSSLIKSHRLLPLGEEKANSICLLNASTAVIGFSSALASLVDLNSMIIQEPVQTTLNVIESLAWYTENQFFAGSDTVIALFNTNFQVLHTFKGHEDSVIKLCVLNSILYSASEDNTVRSWNIHTGISTILYSHESPVLAMDLSHSDSLIASACSEKDLYLFKISEGRIVNSLKSLESKIWSLKFIESKQRIALGTHDSEIILKNIPSLETVKVLSGHSSRIKDLFYDPKLDLLVSGSFDQSIGIWDMNLMILKEFLSIHNDWIRKVVVSERKILSVGDDKVLGLAELYEVKREIQRSRGNCYKWVFVIVVLLTFAVVIVLWNRYSGFIVI